MMMMMKKSIRLLGAFFDFDGWMVGYRRRRRSFPVSVREERKREFMNKTTCDIRPPTSVVVVVVVEPDAELCRVVGPLTTQKEGGSESPPLDELTLKEIETRMSKQ